MSGGTERALRPALARVLFPLGGRGSAAERRSSPEAPVLEEVPLGAGRYELIAPLATGGMAEIFLARRVGLGGTGGRVVVKRLRREVLGNELIERLFLCEGWILSRLCHPNIVRFHDFVRHDGRHHLVLEHVEGVDLARVARVFRASGQCLPVGAVVEVGVAVANALAHAHGLEDDEGRNAGLIHRDVSPHNVVVSVHGEIKLIDFGVAKVRTGPATRDTQVGLVKGKVGYMPPEHLRGRPLDGRADLYALGVVLCELLLGRRLFESDSEPGVLRAVLEGKLPAIRAERPECPAELEAVIRCALAREPKHRFESAEAMAAALEDARPRNSASLREIVALARATEARAQGAPAGGRDGGGELRDPAPGGPKARDGEGRQGDAGVDREGSTRVESRSSAPPAPPASAHGAGDASLRDASERASGVPAAGSARSVVSGERLRPLRARASRPTPAAPVLPTSDRPSARPILTALAPRAAPAAALAPRHGIGSGAEAGAEAGAATDAATGAEADAETDALAEEEVTPTPAPVAALRRAGGFVIAFALGFALAALASRALHREAREVPAAAEPAAKVPPAGAPTHGATLRRAPMR